ncbi:MAG: DUF3080 family protein [Calditrichia bacterium]
MQKHLILSLVSSVISLMLLCSCGRQSPDYATNYMRAVSSTCEKQLISIEEPQLAPYPRQRDLKQQQEELSISLVDFFSLGDCDLQELIAERNNALGRVMAPSKKLIYEHQFLLRAIRCMSVLKMDSVSNAALINELGKAIAVKQRNRPVNFWNATFASPEFTDFFSLANAPQANETSVHVAQEALNSISNFYPSFGREDIPIDLEPAYQALQTSNAIGAVLKRLNRFTFILNTTSAALESRAQNTEPGRSTTVESKEIALQLVRIFKSYYIKRIQPEIAQYNNYANLLFPALQKFVELPELIGTEAFQAYYNQQLNPTADNTVLAQFREATLRHSRAWQIVLDECGLQPGDLL